MMFPLQIVKLVKPETDKDSNAILQHKFELLQLLYSSLDAKQSIVDEMQTKYPECSKKSIERLLKEMSVKVKRDGDERVAYHATQECWNDLTEAQQSELLQLASVRMQPLREEA